MENEQTESLLDTVREQARTNYGLERHCSVVELLSVFLEYRPDDAYMWFVYGDSLRYIGRSEEAERALYLSYEKAPEEEKFWIEDLFANLYKELGQYREAEAWFERAAHRPQSLELDWFWILRGGNLARQGSFERAKECYERAIQIDGDRLDEAYLNMGLVLRATQEYDSASDFFQKAFALDQGYSDTQDAIKSLEGLAEAMSLLQELPKQK